MKSRDGYNRVMNSRQRFLEITQIQEIDSLLERQEEKMNPTQFDPLTTIRFWDMAQGPAEYGELGRKYLREVIPYLKSLA